MSATAMACANCGAAMESEYAVVCGYCGARKGGAEIPKCSHCGAPIKSSQTKCEYCKYPTSSVGRALAILGEPTRAPYIAPNPIARDESWSPASFKSTIGAISLFGIIFVIFTLLGSATANPDLHAKIAEATNALALIVPAVIFLGIGGILYRLTR